MLRNETKDLLTAACRRPINGSQDLAIEPLPLLHCGNHRHKRPNRSLVLSPGIHGHHSCASIRCWCCPLLDFTRYHLHHFIYEWLKPKPPRYRSVFGCYDGRHCWPRHEWHHLESRQVIRFQRSHCYQASASIRSFRCHPAVDMRVSSEAFNKARRSTGCGSEAEQGV